MRFGKPPSSSPSARLCRPRAPTWITLVALLAGLAASPAAAEEPWNNPAWQTRPTGSSGELGIYRVRPEEPGVSVFRDRAGDGYRRHYQSYGPRARDHGLRPPSYNRFYDRGGRSYMGGMSRGPEFSRRSWYTQRGDGNHWRNAPRSAGQGWYGDLGWRDDFRRRDRHNGGERRERDRAGQGGWAPSFGAPGRGGW